MILQKAFMNLSMRSHRFKHVTQQNDFSFYSDFDSALKLLQNHGDGYSLDVTPKDVANLLHAMGKSSEIIKSLESMTTSCQANKVYSEVLVQLKSMIGKPVAPISSRVVYVEVSSRGGPITIDSLRKLFPNMSKVWRVLVSPLGLSALLEFASHSSARRAVDARQQLGSSLNPGDPRCAWISPSVVLPPLELGRATSFPVFEIMKDSSLFCPSSDWRRPRPTTTKISEQHFSACDLLSVLRHAGAFDDYPAELEQLIF
jgi:hypothetical protein